MQRPDHEMLITDEMFLAGHDGRVPFTAPRKKPHRCNERNVQTNKLAPIIPEKVGEPDPSEDIEIQSFQALAPPIHMNSIGPSHSEDMVRRCWKGVPLGR